MSIRTTILSAALLAPAGAWAQGTPAQSPHPQDVVPTPAAETSGWADIGLWGWIGIVVVVVILAVLFWRRR